MKKIANFIVNNRKLMLVIFTILTVFCVMLIPQVKINYDLSSYLPDDSETVRALKVMETEFGVPGAMAVMTKDVSLIEASNLRKEIDSIPGVADAVFLDTMLVMMKTDDSISDEDYTNQMFDLLNLLFRMKEQYFSDRSLGYVYDTMASAMEDIGSGSTGSIGGISIVDLGSILGGFGDGGQDISSIDSEKLDMLETYYTKNCSLITVTMTGDNYAASTKSAIEEIQKIAPKYGESYYSGQAMSIFYNQKDAASEMFSAGIIAVVFIVLILFLVTSSYLEPVIYLGVIAVAIFLNMGTNIFLGSISNYTNLVGALLQLALSMDYSIFLMHAYRDEKKKTLDRVEEVKKALSRSIVSIAASSLTTIAGFVALMFMDFGIGMDFGVVLAKGILFSLLSVFLLMPALILAMDKAMDATQHKSFFSLFKRKKKKKKSIALPEYAANPQANAGVSVPVRTEVTSMGEPLPIHSGAEGKAAETQPNLAGDTQPLKKPFTHKYTDFILKMRKFMPFIFILLMLPMFFFQSGNTFFFGEYQEGNNASSYMADYEQVKSVFGRQNQTVVLISNEYEDKEDEFVEKLKKFKFVKNVTNYATVTSSMDEEKITTEIKAQFKGLNYYRIVFFLDLPDEGDESFNAIDKIEQLLSNMFENEDDYFIMGMTKSVYDIKTISMSDSLLISMLTLVFIFIIILVSFRSISIPLILSLIIQGATWINMAIPYILGQSMHFLGYIIVSGVQMGATIDYGILLTSNYIEERKTKGRRASMRSALAVSIGAILTSSGILTIVGFALGFTSTSLTTSILGMTIGRGTIISVVSMLFILPLFLVLFDGAIRKTTIGGKLMLREFRPLKKPIDKKLKEKENVKHLKKKVEEEKI